MTDTTQGDQLPDVEALFPERPPPDVDSLFPASIENERYRRQQLGTSPVQDFLMSDEGPVGTVFHSAGRVLKAFGQGVDDVGPATGLSKETADYLKKWTGYDKWTEGHQKIAKAAKNVLLDPVAYDWALVTHGLSGVLAGGQAAVAQLGKEVGQEKLAREIAAVPEAYPTFEFRGGMPSPQMAEVARARALDVIGSGGEVAWKGVAAPAESPAPAKAGEAATPSGVRSTAAEASTQGIPLPEILVEAEEGTPARPPAVERPADIHAAARQVDPETFREYDALAARKETFRRWIDELRETRDEQAAVEAPHAEEIADLQRRIDDPDTTNRLRKKYEARLEPLLEGNQAFLDEHTGADSADMTKIRQRLQETDYAMRDLAPKVTAAYRGAQERFPDLVPKEEVPAPTQVASTAAPAEPAAAETIVRVPSAAAEAAPRAIEFERPPVASEKPAETPSVAVTPGAIQPEITPPAPAAEAVLAAQAPATPARTIEQQRDFIRDDVARQLVRAGRPKEEAEAAGALIAARYETRAAMFGGARGTAEDLYREEGAEILGQGMRSRQGPLPPRVTAPRKVNEEKLSLLQFLAHRGGLARTADLEGMLGKNPFVPGFGRLFREGGMTEDRAREAVEEAGYIEPARQHQGGEGYSRERTDIRDLHAAINEEARGRKRYRHGYEPKPEEIDEAEQEYLRESAERELLQTLPGIHIHGIPQGREFHQVTAFHGSPHDFERFDISRIGTGEGAQAYGHGLYFAEEPKVAEDYKKALSGGSWQSAPIYTGDFAGGKQRIKGYVGMVLDQDAKPFAHKEFLTKDEADRWAKETSEKNFPNPGRLYQVSINADPEHFLDWDKPLSDQSPKVKEALQKIGMFTHPDIARLEESIPQAKARLSDIEGTLSPRERMVAQRNIADDEARLAKLKEAQAKGSLNLTVDNLLRHSDLGDQADISAKLRQAGIPGIKYLDQGSRAGGQGTSNYVVFDDKLIDITHKDGEPVSKGEAEQIKQEMAAKPQQREFYQRQAAPPFYSAVSRAIDSAKQEKAPASQWLGMLKNMPGVKGEEMEWLGLEGWLQEQGNRGQKSQPPIGAQPESTSPAVSGMLPDMAAKSSGKINAAALEDFLRRNDIAFTKQASVNISGQHGPSASVYYSIDTPSGTKRVRLSDHSYGNDALDFRYGNDAAPAFERILKTVGRNVPPMLAREGMESRIAATKATIAELEERYANPQMPGRSGIKQDIKTYQELLKRQEGELRNFQEANSAPAGIGPARSNTITKREILDYVRANQIEVKEVEKGGAPDLDTATRFLRGELNGDPAKFGFDTPEKIIAEAHRRGAVSGTGTKFASYQLPGGENYRELLLTLPEEGKGPGRRKDAAGLAAATNVDIPDVAEAADRLAADIQLPGGYIVKDYGPGNPYHRYIVRRSDGRHVSNGSGPTPRQALDNAIAHSHDPQFMAARDVYTSSHFDEPNILAHVRFNDRTIDGKKTLFVEEVQSDWHQKGRTSGYKGDRTAQRRQAEIEAQLDEMKLRAPDDVPAHKRAEWAEANIPEYRTLVDELFANEQTEAKEKNAVPDAPFKTTWPELAMKRTIRYAAENGYDKIAWTTGETQAARYDLSKQIDELHYNPETHRLIAKKGDQRVLDEQSVPPAKLPDYIGKEAADKIMQQEPNVNGFRSLKGLDLKVGGEGMKGFYDQILPAAVSKLTKKFGGKVGKGEIGIAKTEGYDIERSGGGWRLVDAGTRQPIEGAPMFRSGADAEDWIAKNKPTPVHTLDITDKLRDAAVEQGFPLFQGARGKINILEGRRPIVTLMREANASTFIHETGHDFLEQMARDAGHEAAPGQLRADMATTLNWLGVKEGDKITTRAHEKFARGFEQYLREGTAPSPGLANVFAQFRDWLVKIYQTIKGLGAPINDDIRDVFDRMIAEHPQRTVITPEREPAKSFADIHEGDVEATPPARAAPVAENVFAERDSHLREKLLTEEQNVRFTDVAAQDQKPPPGGAQPPSARHETEPLEREGGTHQERGTIGQGGSEALAEGAGAPQGKKSGPSVKSEPPPTVHALFTGPKSALIDKAGNIRLDKLDTADDVTQVIRETAAANDEFLSERRGTLSDIETLQLADAIGMDPAYLERKKIGEAFSVEEIRAARRLLVQSATAVRDAMIAAKDGSTEAIVKLAEAMSTHEMIQSKVAQATAEAGRSLRAFRETIPGYENVSLLDTFLKQQTGRTFFQLQEIARLGSNLRTPQQVGRFVHDTAYGKIKQAIIYYYVNALISGPFTHLRYAVGNALTALWTPLVKIPAAAAFGTVRNVMGFERDAERVYLGEAGAQLYGIMKGSREGLRAALEGWRTGNTPHLPGEAAPNMFEAQPVMPPIPGTLGYMLGLPGKSVGAIHGFFSALRYEQEIHGMAYREAMKQNLSGDAFIGKVTELADRPTEAMMQTAAAQARKDLYMAPADYQSFEAKLARIANHNIGTKILLPFVKIGTQIVRTAMIESTPLGAFDKKVRANLSGENGNAARETQAGQIIAGTALMGVMSGMVLEGLATGDGPSNPAKRAVWLLNHHPNSIQIGDLTLTYERLGALGMLMRTAANATETARGWGDDQGHTIAMDFLYGTERAILGESFLTGIKDMIDAVYHFDEYGQRYMAQMITNWIPFSIGLGQTARKIDPYQREVRGSSLLDAIWKEAEVKVPWLSERLMPRRDMFGEPIPSSGPQQNYENDRVVQRMNELHIGVGRLQHKLRGVDLTDQQFDDHARVAGRTAKMLLNNLIQPGFERLPQGMQVELIHNAITEGRKVGADSVIMKAMGSTNDIMKKSVDTKLEKVTGKPMTVH
jgi:hypothetical protein